MKEKNPKHERWKKKYFDGLPGSVFVHANCKRIYYNLNDRKYKTGLHADFEESWQLAYNFKRNMYLSQNVLNVNPVEKIKNMTIYKAFEEFKEEHFFKISPKTQSSYIDAFNRIFTSDFPLERNRVEKYLSDFSKKDLVKLTNKYTNQVGLLSASSKNIHLRGVSVFLKYIEKYIGVIDLKKYKLKAPAKIKKDYTETELRKLIEYWDAKDREFANLIRFMIYTGGRIGETLDMTWDKVQDDKIIFQNKIDKDEEELPISEPLRKVLTEQREYAASRQHNKNQIFRWQSVTSSRLRKNLTDSMDACGIEKDGRSFHELRKTFKSILKRSGVSLEDAHLLMRHREMRTTVNFYSVDDKEKAKSILNEIIFNI